MTSIQREFIIREIKFVDFNVRVKIKDLVLAADKTAIREHPDGVRIILNKLSDSTINKLYVFIKNQLKYR